MSSSISRRCALLGLLTLPWAGRVAAAPAALASGEGRIFPDIKKVDAAYGAVSIREIHLGSPDGLEIRWRKWCATRQIHPQPPHAGR